MSMACKCGDTSIHARMMCRRCYGVWYRSANAEKIKKSTEIWRRGNVKYARGQKIAHERWRDDNREHLRSYQRENMRKWRANNRDLANSIEATRRARKRGAKVGHLPDNFIAVVKSYYGEQCLSCGAKDLLQLDHVVPLAMGGRHDLLNMQPLCQPCNLRKGGRRAEDYRTGSKLVYIGPPLKIGLLRELLRNNKGKVLIWL